MVSHVWDAVTEAIDRLERHRHLSRLVASSSSIGGEAVVGGLGIIEPTTWPGPQHPQWSSALDTSGRCSLEIRPVRDKGDDDDTHEAAPLMLKTARIVKEVRRGSILWRKKAVKGNERDGIPQKSINRMSISSLAEERTSGSSNGEMQAAAVQGGGQATSRRAVKGEEEESFV